MGIVLILFTVINIIMQAACSVLALLRFYNMTSLFDHRGWAYSSYKSTWKSPRSSKEPRDELHTLTDAKLGVTGAFYDLRDYVWHCKYKSLKSFVLFWGIVRPHSFWLLSCNGLPSCWSAPFKCAVGRIRSANGELDQVDKGFVQIATESSSSIFFETRTSLVWSLWLWQSGTHRRVGGLEFWRFGIWV